MSATLDLAVYKDYFPSLAIEEVTVNMRRFPISVRVLGIGGEGLL